MHILVNLPGGFFRHPALKALFQRLEVLGEVRQRSHNTADEIRADLAWADAVVMWSWPVLTDELLDASPNLRFIGHLDVSQAGARTELRRNISVSISRHGFSPAVSEMALGLILSILRHISAYHARMRTASEVWVEEFPTDINPLERELTGSSVGIIGFGRVGQRLGELLAPFHCQLTVVDPYIPDVVLQRFQAERADLQAMLQRADIVVLCAAANTGTRHVLGREEIALLRENAVLVNVARAVLVDTDALIERLRQGNLFAAIDVFDQEPLAAESVLRTLPNVYLTPHRAGGTISSVQRILSYLIDDLEAFVAGKERQHVLKEAMIPGLDA